MLGLPVTGRVTVTGRVLTGLEWGNALTTPGNRPAGLSADAAVGEADVFGAQGRDTRDSACRPLTPQSANTSIGSPNHTGVPPVGGWSLAVMALNRTRDSTLQVWMLSYDGTVVSLGAYDFL